MKQILIAIIFIPLFSSAQTTGCSTISMPDTISVCSGSTVTLPAMLTGTDSIVNILWTPATGLSGSSILNPALTGTTSGWYRLSVNSISSDNLVVNGSFTAGNTGFSTGYTYIATATSIPNEYGVGTNPDTYNPGWPSMGDHTTGTGNMLLVDGSTTAGTSFWCETIVVTSATNYVFSVWSASLWLPLPSIQITINGIVTDTFAPSSTVGTWVQYQFTWNSGDDTLANICLTDLDLAYVGNDFAIDDISLRRLCVARDSEYVLVGSNAGIISGADSVCVGQTVTLSETVAGGIWSTSSFTISDISSAGEVRGLSPGMDTVVYTVSSSCGIVSAIFPFFVRPYAECSTGINTVSNHNDDLKIYPDPANDKLNISSASGITLITITNLLGQNVFTHEYNTPSVSVQVDVFQLPPGVYFVKVNGSEFKRFLKE